MQLFSLFYSPQIFTLPKVSQLSISFAPALQYCVSDNAASGHYFEMNPDRVMQGAFHNNEPLAVHHPLHNMQRLFR